jgi:hypothetical protein
MYPSADLCRVQEAFQRRRAESAPLGNVRTIAQKAAAAWAAEALYAEGREQRQAQVRAFRANEIDKQRAACEQLDIASSENPDRGRAAPSVPPHRL